MNIYELYGRAREALENESEQHRRTIALLSQVVSGEIERSRVLVTGNTWNIIEDFAGADGTSCPPKDLQLNSRSGG